MSRSTTTTSMPLPLPPSLWSLIAPFDHHGHFLSQHLWPLLTNYDIVQAMTTNSHTLVHSQYWTVQQPYTLTSIAHLHINSNVRCRPRFITVTGAEVVTLATAMPRLLHITSLGVTVRQPPDSKTTPRLRLPSSLTHLHITVPASMCHVLSSLKLPSTLHELTIDDTIHSRSATTKLLAPLPAHVHTLHIRCSDWQSSEQLYAESSQLHAMSIVSASHYFPLDGSRLPRSLTELDLSRVDYRMPLKSFDLPNLVTLRLGLSKECPHGHRWGFSEPITAGSFNRLPVLRELDISHATDYTAAIAELPATLTSLALPVSYRQRMEVDLLPASLTRLQFGATSSRHSGLVPPASTTATPTTTAVLSFCHSRSTSLPRVHYATCALPQPTTRHSQHHTSTNGQSSPNNTIDQQRRTSTSLYASATATTTARHRSTVHSTAHTGTRYDVLHATATTHTASSATPPHTTPTIDMSVRADGLLPQADSTHICIVSSTGESVDRC